MSLDAAAGAIHLWPTHIPAVLLFVSLIIITAQQCAAAVSAAEAAHWLVLCPRSCLSGAKPDCLLWPEEPWKPAGTLCPEPVTQQLKTCIRLTDENFVIQCLDCVKQTQLHAEAEDV